jgi:hypothetical protein
MGHPFSRSARRATALGVAALLIVGGGAYAFASSGRAAITVCVTHHGGTLYRARKCAKHDTKLTWSRQGPPGATGSRGPKGDTGATGAQGPKGDTGATGPTTTQAPAGSTQRGVIAIQGYQTAVGSVSNEISFPLTLSSAPTVDEVVYPNTDSHCSGSSGAPTAAPGYLCIYIVFQSNNYYASTSDPLYPQEPGTLNFGASTFGTILTAKANTTGTVDVVGSWAVTAP